MNVKTSTIHTFTVSHSEMCIILRALRESKQREAKDLAVELAERLEKSNREIFKEIERRFHTQMVANFKDDENAEKNNP